MKSLYEYSLFVWWTLMHSDMFLLCPSYMTPISQALEKELTELGQSVLVHNPSVTREESDCLFSLSLYAPGVGDNPYYPLMESEITIRDLVYMLSSCSNSSWYRETYRMFVLFPFRSNSRYGSFPRHNLVWFFLDYLFGIHARAGCQCAGPYHIKVLGV